MEGKVSKGKVGKEKVRDEKLWNRKAEEVSALEWIDGLRKGFRRES